MNILAFDTVLNKSYIGILFEGKKIYKTIESDEKNYHSVYLIREIKNLLAANSIPLNRFDYISINRGTGSFTGIRVGLSIAKVISGELNIKVIGLNTFEILSSAYNNKNIMTNAGRGSVFYSNDGKSAKMISFEDGINILKNSSESFITDNLQKNEKFENVKDKLISYEEKNIDLAPYELNLAEEKAKGGIYTDVIGIKPLYIQTPPVFSK